MKKFSAVILAAGSSKRMKSCFPKAIHTVSGKPLIKWIIDSVSLLKPDNLVVVLGWNSGYVEKILSYNNSIKIVYQKEQLGSGHALLQAIGILKNYKNDILVLGTDIPLIKSSTLLSLIKNNKKTGSSATVLIAQIDNPHGYGRVFVNDDGYLEKIVEENNATLIDKQIKIINSGIYCFNESLLWDILSKLKPNNINNEYYITDTIAIFNSLGKKVSSITVKDSYEVKGINTRLELFEVENLLKQKKIEELLNDGVTIIDINNVYISYDAKVGKDSIIYPNVFIDIGVSIGKNCTIMFGSYIKNSVIGDMATVLYSYIDGAIINENVRIGPFSHIRSNSVLKKNVVIGNFSEIKKSMVSENSKISHLSYIGDAEIG
ncbi:MAG: bifunctional UDP-N-acetylglucosamine diphosphorylase/glucosamine-1-phosphate N-acetyltransferase GlmU, partial [Endomicrobium sp.]|nr:bifunctional UDP-N-acetylglucosamine diphosphorylase/glucosamine-1-phosphate N-acetyltransferase GlmU [Endomicrobium sp.]